MQEVGLLGHIYAISAASGGAITAAILALHQGPVNPETETWTYDRKEFEKLLLETATRGLLGRTTVLVTAYLFYALAALAAMWWWFGWPSARWVLLALVGMGFLLHLGLIGRLIMDKAYTHFPFERIWAKIFCEPAIPAISLRSVRRFFKMIFTPSYLRLETLNARLFHGGNLKSLRRYPGFLFNALNLNDGRQKNFFHGGVVNLDSDGCRRLWLGEEDIRFKNVTIAEAVAASSALPLFFRPVTIWNGDELLGVFVDGGVADNLALNVPKAFATFVHPSAGQVYQSAIGGYIPFRDFTSLVLIADGSMPLPEKQKRRWTRLFSVKRVSDAMLNQQVSDASITAFGFRRNVEIPTWIVSLQFGMPDCVTHVVPRLKDVLHKVRTHLDSFSLQECAVLSFYGYALIETLLKEEMPGLLNQYQGTQSAPFRQFSEILPAELGVWDATPNAIERVMRYANRRLLPARWIGRTFGV